MYRRRLRRWVERCALSLVVLVLIAWGLDRLYPLADVPAVSTLVLAEDGTPLRAFPGEDGQWRYPIQLDQVAPQYIDLLLAYEDRWFYYHPGVNPIALVRALWQNAYTGKVVSGGSTLTMQVARLLHPHERTYSGKLQQILRALQLEWHFSKQDILRQYLNLAPFGGILSGVQAASYHYFGKPANRLSDAEAALLAVLPQRPSHLRPDRHPARAKAARNKVLQRMVDLHIWRADRVNDALWEPLNITTQGTPIVAPIVSRRLYQACPECEVIHSTIDYELQLTLEGLTEQFRHQLSDQQSLAIVVMNNRDGAIKGYVGSADFWSQSRSGQVDMVRAVRSPGSTLKPFLYGMAIDDGLIHAQSMLIDAPRRRSEYRPRNFTDQFNGPISVTQALQRSLNVPAVQLLEFFGPGRFLSRLQNAGLSAYGPGAIQPNISMILGGVGVRLEDMLSLYSGLAREGVAIYPRLTQEEPRAERYLMSLGAAWITWDILAQHPYRRLQDKTQQGWNLAWKTGTSYGYREAWALGVSPEWTIGVWVGRPDGSPSPGRHGRIAAAPLLFRVHAALRQSHERLPQPQSVSEQLICWPLGTHARRGENQRGNCVVQRPALLLNDVAPRTLQEVPEVSLEGLLKMIWIDPESGLRAEPTCFQGKAVLQPSSVALWPVALAPWLPSAWRNQSRLPALHPDCQQLVGEQVPIRITSWADGAIIRVPKPEEPVSLDLIAEGGSGYRDWYVNGGYIGRSEHSLSFEVIESGIYQISVIDQQGSADQLTIRVSL